MDRKRFLLTMLVLLPAAGWFAAFIGLFIVLTLFDGKVSVLASAAAALGVPAALYGYLALRWQTIAKSYREVG